MKVNQWTMGLAAAGVISFGAVAQAEEKPSHQVLTAVSSTALSGYISTSASWEPGKSVVTKPYSYAKGEGFALDVIDIKLSSPLAEGEYASGYNVELWLGPDATTGIGNNITGAANGSSVAVKNANVSLNVPVGTGLQAKVGIFDTVVGYESANSIENPNYSRSIGNSIEPTSHTGVLLGYKFCDGFSANVGVANSFNAAVNANNAGASTLTYLASISVTAPDSLGFLKGAVLNAGVVDGDTTATTGTDNTHIYVGATLPTPIEALKLGVAYDHLNIDKSSADTDALAIYASYKLSDKATLNSRFEWATGFSTGTELGIATLTLDYALWANVVSRVEYRLTHDLNGGKAARTAGNNGHQFTGQIAYKF